MRGAGPLQATSPDEAKTDQEIPDSETKTATALHCSHPPSNTSVLQIQRSQLGEISAIRRELNDRVKRNE